MKKFAIMVCMLSVLLTGTSYAAHTKYGVANATSGYTNAVRGVFKTSQVEERLIARLHTWAKKGNVAAFNRFIEQTNVLRNTHSSRCGDGKVLVAENLPNGYVHPEDLHGECVHPEVVLRADSSKNNLLHNAKNRETLLAVEETFRVFFPQSNTYLNKLKNEKNKAKETPLVYHTSQGDLDSFDYLYSQSELQNVLGKIKGVLSNPSLLVRESSLQILEQEFSACGKDASGKDIGYLVRMAAPSYGRDEALSILEKDAPFLF